MAMNLEQLRGFVEVADAGHFTRAAEHLHLTQPSLSRQIATLEASLGVELFHRARGNISLTAAGELLLPTARRMLADANTARSDMAELAGLKRGSIRLGATPTLCTTLVPEVLASYRVLYPGIDIEILESGSKTLIQALLEGTLDFALIVTRRSTKVAREALTRKPLLHERLVAISAASSEDPFASASTRGIELKDLEDAPNIVFPKNYDLRTTIDQAFEKAGLSPSIAVEGAEMDAALRFAEHGVGIAIVPAMVALDQPRLRATPLADPSLARTISIAHRSDMNPTQASLAAQRLIHEVADRLTAPGTTPAEFMSRVTAADASTMGPY